MDESELRQSLRLLIDIDNEVYSTRMAAVFCLGLSALLWWIPVFGPAVAGYVCGRKTGSMVKGFICSLFSGALLLIMVKGLSALVLGAGGYPDVPADEAAAVLTKSAGVAAAYLQTFFTAGTASLDYVNLGILVVFGGTGGILSRQIRKETAHLIEVGATEGSNRHAARSVRLYSMNKEIGFRSYEDCIASQRMTTNENTASDARAKGERTEAPKAHEGRPVATTVQTVTTTVSGSNAKAQTGATGNPFSDILDRSDRNK